MSWLPDLNKTFILIRRIEANEEPLRYSSELFWLFCTKSMSPESYHERIMWMRNEILIEKRGDFNDSEVKELMYKAFDNPDEAAQTIVSKLDNLAETTRIEFIPDGEENPKRLFISTHIEACRVFRWVNLERYSERTRDGLKLSLITFERFMLIDAKHDTNMAVSDLLSIYLIGSFLYSIDFKFKKAEGEYETAIASISKCIENLQKANSLYETPKLLIKMGLDEGLDSFNVVKNSHVFQYISYSEDRRLNVPWINDISTQDIVDCCEALKSATKITDLNSLIESIWDFDITNDIWPSEDPYVAVHDADDIWWGVIEYWRHFSGWLEAQLTPSEFKMIVNEREEEAAEKRLQKYFFGNNTWDQLPDRTKRSLRSADRDWFSGSTVRFESVLNELKIATEELLIQNFWRPLLQWLNKSSTAEQESPELSDLRASLVRRKKQPSISDFAFVCKISTTKAYLVEKGVSEEDRVWFSQTLPDRLYHLLNPRNRAEHEPGSQFSHEELREFYNEFIGIGQPGVIRQLSQLLNSIHDKD